MTVAKNIAFGLDVRKGKDKPSKAEIGQRVEDLLKLVELDGLGKRYPSQLSGGQRQRVALSRALAVQPSVLLLDEPFGALDATVRKSLRRELRRVHDATGVTTIFVTHDQEEALELADRVAILNKGEIEQIGTPDQVHDQPETAFVCGFVGEANCFEGQVSGGRFSAGALGLPASGVREGSATAYVRPHDFVLDDGGFEVRVDRAHVQGALTTVNATAADGRHIEISASRAEAAHFQGTVKIAARKAHVYAA
jgi:sulfate transport system ATP-binding protein